MRPLGTSRKLYLVDLLSVLHPSGLEVMPITEHPVDTTTRDLEVMLFSHRRHQCIHEELTIVRQH